MMPATDSKKIHNQRILINLQYARKIQNDIGYLFFLIEKTLIFVKFRICFFINTIHRILEMKWISKYKWRQWSYCYDNNNVVLVMKMLTSNFFRYRSANCFLIHIACVTLFHKTIYWFRNESTKITTRKIDKWMGSLYVFCIVWLFMLDKWYVFT